MNVPARLSLRPKTSSRWCSLLALLALGGCGDPVIIVPDVMSVVALLPPHGSGGIARDVQPLAYLSHEVKEISQVVGGFSLRCVGAPVNDSCSQPDASACDTQAIAATVTYDPSDLVARLTPGALLEADTCYLLSLAEGIESAEEHVGPIPAEIRSAFRTQ